MNHCHNNESRDKFCYASSIRSIYQVLTDVFAAAFAKPPSSDPSHSLPSLVNAFQIGIVALHPTNFVKQDPAQDIVSDYARNRNIALNTTWVHRLSSASYSKAELGQMLVWLNNPSGQIHGE